MATIEDIKKVLEEEIRPLQSKLLSIEEKFDTLQNLGNKCINYIFIINIFFFYCHVIRKCEIKVFVFVFAPDYLPPLSIYIHNITISYHCSF